MMEGHVDVTEELVGQIKDYLFAHGLVMRTKQQPTNGDLVTHVPVTLLPSPVPRALYEEAINVQDDINLLMHRVAHDYDFLKDCLEKVIKVDDFTGHLWQIYDTVTKEGIAQPYSLGLNRSDYMFDCGSPITDVGTKINYKNVKLRQIEVNLMASSFGGLSQQLDGYHRFILNRFNRDEQIPNIPSNGSVDILARGMVTAWQHYNNPQSVIVFLVYSDEGNVYDQRLLEYAVYKQNHKVKVIRRSMQDIQSRGQLTADKNLVIDGLEVAIVYQRCLYTPSDYKTEQDWETRLLIERSRAIKCPSASYHLAGTKKVQQVLAQRGMVERFITDAEAVARIRHTFAGQYSLDLDEEGDKAVAMAMENPHLYVLKPQREGGGNNTFGEEIRTVLTKIKNSDERTAYILMEHIHPVPVQNHMIRSGSPVELHTCVSELGIFGAFVGTKEQVLLNISGGHILRTKTVGTDEGGIASGYSCLDSPCLKD